MIGLVAILLTSAAEALALYTVDEWLSVGYDGPAAPAWVLVGVAMAAFWFPRAVDAWAPQRAATAIAAAGAFVVVYGAMRIAVAEDFRLWDFGWAGDFLREPKDVLSEQGRAVITFMFVATAWGRMAHRSASDIELDTIARGMAWPFLVVTTVILAGAGTAHAGEIVRGGAVFYAVAVLALAASQLGLSGATFGDLRAGGVTAVLAAGTVGVTIVAVIAFWIGFGVLAPVLGPPAGRVAQFVLLIVLYPPAWILQQILQLMLGDNDPFAQFAANARDAAGTAREGGEEDQSGFARVMVYAGRAVSLVLVFAVAALVVGYFVRLGRRRSGSGGGAAERIGAGSIGEDARGLLGGLFHGRRRSRTPADLTPARRLYFEVLDAANLADVGRRSGATPAELAPELRRTFNSPLTDDITRAFEASRYAGRDPEPGAVAELERRWRELRSRK